MQKIKKILIANRGEIACRIIKTAQRLGIQTVVAHSSIDTNSLAVQLSDEAVNIGFAPASESYLNMHALIAAAKKTQADAIHPGYGFVSENAEFADLCHSNNIIFIGPPSAAIRAMADKTEAKKIMQQAGVPITPGYLGEDQSIEAFTAAAAKIGFPVLVKATAGGGGKGMRLVTKAEELADAITSAKRESLKSFKSDHVFLEKYVNPARHIEIQIFTDQHGKGVHLFERDCSTQRRHQKIIEEAAAANLSDETAAKMAATAVKAALAIKYVGAGTFEFLVDQDENFYFMEMNTRLQVEHPVTEMITDLDLVEWQIRVAEGAPLPLTQAQIHKNGHALEVRIYSEDPNKNFAPSIGTVTHLQFPEQGEQVRIDCGIRAKDNISIYYDPMIAKLIVWTKDRPSAIQLLQKALSGTFITGITTNIDFLKEVIQSPQFQQGKVSTQFLDTHSFKTIAPEITEKVIANAAIALAQSWFETPENFPNYLDQHSPWQQREHWRLFSNVINVSLWSAEKPFNIEVKKAGTTWSANLNQKSYSADSAYRCFVDPDLVHVFHQGQHYQINRHFQRSAANIEQQQQKTLSAPMPGTVVEIYVQPGQKIKAGEKLLVLEAMKMEHTLQAAADAVIANVICQKGEQLREGSPLIEFGDHLS